MRSRLLLIGVGLMIGCATVYGPRGNGGDGYTDWPTGPGRFHIEVVGNKHTDSTTLRQYFHMRATELCSDSGPGTYKGDPQTMVGDQSIGIVVGRGWAAAREHTSFVVFGDVFCDPGMPAVATEADAGLGGVASESSE